jgi:hypothetical protein
MSSSWFPDCILNCDLIFFTISMSFHKQWTWTSYPQELVNVLTWEGTTEKNGISSFHSYNTNCLQNIFNFELTMKVNRTVLWTSKVFWSFLDFGLSSFILWLGLTGLSLKDGHNKIESSEITKALKLRKTQFRHFLWETQYKYKTCLIIYNF